MFGVMLIDHIYWRYWWLQPLDQITEDHKHICHGKLIEASMDLHYHSFILKLINSKSGLWIFCKGLCPRACWLWKLENKTFWKKCKYADDNDWLVFQWPIWTVSQELWFLVCVKRWWKQQTKSTQKPLVVTWGPIGARKLSIAKRIRMVLHVMLWMQPNERKEKKKCALQ